MKKKILLLILLSPLLLIFYLIGAVQNTTAEIFQNGPSYIISNNSFEHSQNTDLYYEEIIEAQGTYKAQASKLLGFVWTKTGDLVSVLNSFLCNAKDAVSGESDQTNNPLTQSSGISSFSLLKGANESHSTIAKALGPHKEVFLAIHGHPWMFLMTFTLGTILLSLWFLRLSTGASPPIFVPLAR